MTPTLMPVSSNFDASVVEEDTWVRQLHQNGKRLLFMGDDTWQSMFPAEYFSRAFFYPSFDVKVGKSRDVWPLV